VRRKKNKSSLGVLALFAIIIGGVMYMYSSPIFERNVPTIDMKTNGYWNLKTPFNITMRDVSGIKAYKIIIKTKNEEIILENEQFLVAKKSLKITLNPPKSVYAIKDDEIQLIIKATDTSKWNIMLGNTAKEVYKLKIDKRKPELYIIANSTKIKKGGAALVIFEAKDKNIKNIYIKTSYGKKFLVQPFYKKNYYISLLAWPVTENDFRATIVADDSSKNISEINIPLYNIHKQYRISNIKLSDKFLKGKIAQLAEEFSQTQGVEDSIEQFKIINEVVRAKNEKLIHEITSKVSTKMISNFKINKLYPLKSALVVAYFGDHRKYSYNKKHVSESYHLGLDMASVAHAEIKPQNSGDIVFADDNGIYGNMPIISHGLGLYTLYGHCSYINVSLGDNFKEKTTIAKTGKSGYAMGDHLHFGVLIQGIEVHPKEWMDDRWMNRNIYDIIESAKKKIGNK
jgi:murein DD-endopeptidase MepM/ murein hydrolase activator NlpD